MNDLWPNMNRFLQEDKSKTYTEYRILFEFHIGKFEFTIGKQVKKGVKV